MSKEKSSLDLASIKKDVVKLFGKLTNYSYIIFFVFIAGLYGFVFLKINTLSSAEPSSIAVDSQVKSATVPHIDKGVLQQLNSLQDNSVSVQALFDEARNSPFQ